MQNDQTERHDAPFFGAYSKPNYTTVPDELFDQQLAYLSGAELKVLLYIIRRTFGFKKDSDSISLSQICNGITTRDGRALDHGTGLSKRHVIAALKALAKMGIIAAERRSSPERGFESTVYQLNVSDNTLVTKGNKGSAKREQALVTKGNIQETVLQETVLQETDHSNIRMAHALDENQSEENQPRPSRANNPGSGFKAVGTILEPRKPPQTSTSYDENRQAILAYIEDFAREFNDKASLKTSTTRAVNLCRRSGTSLEAFIGAMFEARAITKERSAAVRSTTDGSRGIPPTKRKMAYFFSVLEDKLGLREPSETGPQNGAEDRNKRGRSNVSPPRTPTRSDPQAKMLSLETVPPAHDGRVGE